MSTATRISRREFLCCGAALPAAACLPAPFARAANLLDGDVEGRVLVIVQLTGGNDGLNTVVPWADDDYHRARPVLALAADKVVRLTDDTGLHPSLAPLRPIFDAGRLAIVRGAGPPHPDRSHFRSMEIWHTASEADPAPARGWVGAAGGRLGAGVPVIRAGARDLPLAVAGGGMQPPALKSLDDLQVAAAGSGPARTQHARLARACTAHVGRAGEAAWLAEAADAAFDMSDRLAALRSTAREDLPGGELGRALGLVSLLVGARLGLRIAYVTHDGYDTHARQVAGHAALLRELGSALAGFDARLAEQGDRGRVAVLVFSEFGRRVHENASGGTDHGAGAPLLLLGEPVRGGVLGDPPALAGDDERDVPVTLDFRHAYAAALAWLGVPPASVLPGDFAPLPVLAG